MPCVWPSLEAQLTATVAPHGGDIAWASSISGCPIPTKSRVAHLQPERPCAAQLAGAPCRPAAPPRAQAQPQHVHPPALGAAAARRLAHAQPQAAWRGARRCPPIVICRAVPLPVPPAPDPGPGPDPAHTLARCPWPCRCRCRCPCLWSCRCPWPASPGRNILHQILRPSNVIIIAGRACPCMPLPPPPPLSMPPGSGSDPLPTHTPESMCVWAGGHIVGHIRVGRRSRTGVCEHGCLGGRGVAWCALAWAGSSMAWSGIALGDPPSLPYSLPPSLEYRPRQWWQDLVAQSVVGGGQ